MTSEVLACFEDCPIEPVGYRIVLGQLPPEARESGIIIPDSSDTQRAQELLSSISQIVKVGPLVYEADHFKTFEERRTVSDGKRLTHVAHRPWAKVGNWVIHGANAGYRLPVERNGVKTFYRILNDDEFLAVVPDIDALKAQMPLLTYDLTT